MLDFYIIIPAFNEEKHISLTLDSIVKQSFLPKKVVVVNDNSTDRTAAIVEAFTKQYSFISTVNTNSEPVHLPGSKVIQAFNRGLEIIDNNYDFIVKLDADLILPENYFEKISAIFAKNPRVGMAGGRAYIKKENVWILESLTDDDHIRGAFKAYRKECFLQIGKLKTEMGWDTVDELLSRFYGWQIIVDKSLQVKHLKPTGSTYNKNSRYKQGEAFYRLGYGFWITFLASLKLASRKKKPLLFMDYLTGFFQAKKQNKPLLVTPEQAQFVRAYRWKKIKSKLGI